MKRIGVENIETKTAQINFGGAPSPALPLSLWALKMLGGVKVAEVYDRIKDEFWYA